jgi:hypothetical protein
VSSRKRDRTNPRTRLSPTHTLANASDEFIDSLRIPSLPDRIPGRLEDALIKRINAFLYQLREARRDQYVEILEIRLVRDAHRAVLTAFELNLNEAEIFYATFRQLVEDLGYERTDVGYRKVREGLDL